MKENHDTTFNDSKSLDSLASEDNETCQLNGSENDEHLNTQLVDQFSDEFELPEVIICYKDTYYDIVKDICIDEGMLEKDKNSIEHCKDDASEEKLCVDTKVPSSSIESEVLHDQKATSPDNHSDSNQVQCTELKENSIGEVHEQSDNTNKLTNSHDNSSDARSEIVETESTGHDNVNLDKSQSCIIVNGQGDETHNLNHSGELCNVNQLKYDFGESSFSAAGHVTFSGPIAYSGSLSIRSEASAASARSFAFPILQTEWDTSPVRMARADRRQLSKTKGWRSGILCCRF